MTTNSQPLSRSEKKRAQVLESAIELFCAQGFPNTSMDEVAKHAGVSKQTVYSHFGSKDDLFIASITSKCVVHNMTEGAFVDVENPVQALVEFGIHFNQMIVSPEAITVFRACVAQHETHPEVSELFYDAGPENLLGLLANYLERLEQGGSFQFDHYRHAAVRLCLMLYGEMRLKLELGLDASDLEDERIEYVKQTVNMFLRAYRI
ncbi:TetR/AcrR family transcriptional regulator [Shewanella waksmanii]|uniref:TetR/AcrR family transcriptional regulator n=1 Tax=Shewanella waksmanii TaxID=213783 RepID=UPI003734D6C8